MIYSQACAYALHALCRLTLLQDKGPVRIHEICAHQSLPQPFVAKIFQDLARRGILTSARGRGGGFVLSRPAEEILVIDIVEAIDGSAVHRACISGFSECNDEQPCPMHERFKPLRAQIREFMSGTSLADLACSLKHKIELTVKQTDLS